jgi:hypothetical protein
MSRAGGGAGAIARARALLAKAEAAAAWADALAPVEDALALLADVVDASAGDPSREVARNVGAAYARTLYGRIETRLRTPHLSEPELEQIFALIRALDDRELPLPERARDVKVDVVTRLVDFYCEGFAPAEKQRVLAQLAGIVA